jgi:hypothetical protein
MGGWMGGWMDGWMDGWIIIITFLNTCKLFSRRG